MIGMCGGGGALGVSAQDGAGGSGTCARSPKSAPPKSLDRFGSDPDENRCNRAFRCGGASFYSSGFGTAPAPEFRPALSS